VPKRSWLYSAGMPGALPKLAAAQAVTAILRLGYGLPVPPASRRPLREVLDE